MSYQKKTIQKIVYEIEQEKAFLPAIQRKFVWPRWKIEHLFDSLMRNYPIGSFLFWELTNKKADDYVFYSFLKHYDQRHPNNKRKTGAFTHPEIIGVLDGQQRLSSMYLGLQGSHRQRKRYARTNDDSSYPECFLYLDLLSLPYTTDEQDVIDLDRERGFEFRFLTTDQASQTTRRNDSGMQEPCFWFKPDMVLRWGEDPEIDNQYDNLLASSEDEAVKNSFTAQKRFIKKALRDMHKRICQDEIINYFQVTKEDLDDILEIFIRVNSGGTILSRTDLLFSTIVATWEDGRDEIEAFLQILNQKGDGFRFNNDFLMRSCLVLSDLPVLFKVNSFKSENVTQIKTNWPAIQRALLKTVDTLVSFGFSGPLLTSQNAVIVIAYYFMKGGSQTEEAVQNIRKYLLHALLKNVYGGQGDRIIASFRNQLRIQKEDKNYGLKEAVFPYENMLALSLPANKSLKIDEDDLEEFMNYKKGAASFFVLSLVYPNLRYNEVRFHQDHIHPHAGFTAENLEKAGIASDKQEQLMSWKDTVPNLQLMEGRQNESKNATPLAEWVKGKDGKGKQNVADLEKFKADNHIPKATSLEFSQFEQFYSDRKAQLKKELRTVLGLPKNP